MLGMTLLRKFELPEYKLNLYFMAFGKDLERA